ncbi:MAG: helix-turn-helix transcriptional regulator [Clostridia bacterium]|nr:helix-turn-helix transcriptional regulator [Clostridia bacterium]MBR4636462.1 helix-turn-helix transcriptional regulator [Clostridia bacterium]
MDFGKKIADARMAANMTQQELAEKLFVSRELISKWENGLRRPNYGRDNPPSGDPVPADYMLRPVSYYIPLFSGDDQWSRMAFARGTDKEGIRITIQEEYNLDEIDHSVVSSTVRYDNVDKLKISDPIWQPMTLSEAEARKLAESFVQSAGLSDYVLYRVTPRYADNMGVAVFYSTTEDQKHIGYTKLF